MSVPTEQLLVLSALLFSIGVAGFFVRRNVIVVLMSIELMLNAANLAFLAGDDVPLLVQTLAFDDDNAPKGQGVDDRLDHALARLGREAQQHHRRRSDRRQRHDVFTAD